MQRILIILIVVAILVAILFKNKDRKIIQKENLKKVTIVLDWTPNTNHTGIYVAKTKKFYKEAGLDVQIVQPLNATSDTLVATNKADFGISTMADLLNKRSQNAPLVSVAAIIQHNTSGFYSIAKKNIKTPKDFEGKTYGGWGSPIEVFAIKEMMNRSNGDFSKLKMLTVGNINFFATTKTNIDFIWGYEAWTGIEAEILNIPVNYIKLTNYIKEADEYNPIIIVNENTIKNNPKLVRKFIIATQKGYNFAINNPKAAAFILLKNVPELNKQLVIKSQEYLKNKYQADAYFWGYQKRSVWENYMKWLVKIKVLSEPQDIRKAYTNAFTRP